MKSDLILLSTTENSITFVSYPYGRNVVRVICEYNFAERSGELGIFPTFKHSNGSTMALESRDNRLNLYNPKFNNVTLNDFLYEVKDIIESSEIACAEEGDCIVFTITVEGGDIYRYIHNGDNATLYVYHLLTYEISQISNEECIVRFYNVDDVDGHHEYSIDEDTIITKMISLE